MNDVWDENPLDEPPPWDGNDPRRKDDCFAPPAEPCECYCLHCGRTFMSDQIWLQRAINARDGFNGFWMCPTPNCDGAGFTFDIFPTDPTHPANEGWHYSDDDEEFDEDCFDEQGNYIEPENRVYNPEEPKFKALDVEYGDADDEEDIEGEEWKYGMEPGQPPPEPEWSAEARKEWEQEQKRYDEPDLRPREVDWKDRDTGPKGEITDDDIPF